MKKAKVTRELVNVFPSWSKVRKDSQSLGFRYLNAIGIALEDLDFQLQDMGNNQYLTTANVDEIDLTYRVQLPASFEFDTDDRDPADACPVPPTVSGLDDGTWYPVTIAEGNDIESFWYTSVPNRASVGQVVSGIDDALVSFPVTDTCVSGVWEHHLGGGYLTVEAIGGVQYITFDEGEVNRGQIHIEGKTRKGTEETEILVFPWDMKQHTVKEWKEIYKVTAYNMEDTVEIDVYSSDFNQGPYISHYNTRFSERRRKIDEFWDLGNNFNGLPVLNRVEYITDEWQQLILGFSDQAPVEWWELLEDTDDVVSGIDITVSGIDMAVQPFTERAWVVADNNQLYLYDLSENLVSGVNLLKESTPGAKISIEFEDPCVVLGEDIEFTPWHARPLAELIRYRVWVQKPDGTRNGISNGSLVPFTSDFTVTLPSGTELQRSIGDLVSFTADQRGEYVITFEADFVDGTTETYKRIAKTNYKLPLATIDLSSDIASQITGIDFDSDQRLWVKTLNNDIFEVVRHTDTMLIDYANKIIYFKEPYENVGIETDG